MSKYFNLINPREWYKNSGNSKNTGDTGNSGNTGDTEFNVDEYNEKISKLLEGQRNYPEVTKAELEEYGLDDSTTSTDSLTQEIKNLLVQQIEQIQQEVNKIQTLAQNNYTLQQIQKKIDERYPGYNTVVDKDKLFQQNKNKLLEKINSIKSSQLRKLNSSGQGSQQGLDSSGQGSSYESQTQNEYDLYKRIKQATDNKTLIELQRKINDLYTSVVTQDNKSPVVEQKNQLQENKRNLQQKLKNLQQQQYKQLKQKYPNVDEQYQKMLKNLQI